MLLSYDKKEDKERAKERDRKKGEMALSDRPLSMPRFRGRENSGICESIRGVGKWQGNVTLSIMQCPIATLYYILAIKLF